MRSLRSGRVLYARDAEKNFKPASTLKLVTTAAALDAFGPDARLRTTVETAGRLDAYGRILGDVYLVGRGDPNLSGRFHAGRATAPLEELADALQKPPGVRRIEGRLVGHEGLFQGDRRGEDWAWGDLVWSYGAEVSALSFNDNAAQLSAARRRARGRPAGGGPRPADGALHRRLHGRDLGRRHARPSSCCAPTRARTCSGCPARLPAAAASPGRAAWPSPIPRATPPPSSARSWPREGIRVIGPVGHLVRSAAGRPARAGRARERADVRDREGGQQAQPEPAHGDAAAPARRAGEGRGHGGGRPRGGRGLPAPPERARGELGPARRVGPQPVRRGDAAGHGRAARGNGAAPARRRCSATACPWRVWTARSRAA